LEKERILKLLGQPLKDLQAFLKVHGRIR